ncbi:MAG TPA: hypothetical protein VF070_41985 [Streptosporangiaceae bacterium]
MAPKIPQAAIGTLLQMCAQQRGLVHSRIAAHHQHPALTCSNSLQKPDEHVTSAMPAYGLHGGSLPKGGHRRHLATMTDVEEVEVVVAPSRARDPASASPLPSTARNSSRS